MCGEGDGSAAGCADTGCLGAGSHFYYGLDNATPAGTINLFIVLLHELGHGLGSSSFTNGTNGQYLGNIPDIWARFQKMRGMLTPAEHDTEIAFVREHLAALKKPHWEAFLAEG